MRRREPPSSATWMLEHLSSGDEALAGDLLEEFHRGRSDGWYMRQVFTACAFLWLKSLRQRIPLLVFALLWSMLAPAWKVFCDRVESAPILDKIWQMTGGLWVFPALASWTVLHSCFLWAGILVYILFHTSLGKTFPGAKFRRAFLLPPLIFAPIYGVTFLLANLYWYTVFPNATLAATPLGQIADLKILADVIRIPYFVALLCSLWGVVPRSVGNLQPLFAGSTPDEFSTQSDSLALVSRPDPFTLRRFFVLMVVAGVINAMIAGFLLCRLPESHAPTFASLFIRAMSQVVFAMLAGLAGTWVYWKSPASPFREQSPIPFPLFALVCASGWVWVPSMVIFSEQVSAASAFVAMISAYLLASGIRSATYLVFAPAQGGPSIEQQGGATLFAESLYQPPAETHGYLIAIGLYGAGAALISRSNYTAAVLLALCASLFAWKKTFSQSPEFEKSREYQRAALRLSRVAIPAVLVTIWALLDGVSHRDHVAGTNASRAAGNGATNEGVLGRTISQPSSFGLGGYESLILWPVPPKKQIYAPLLARESLLAPGTTRPLIIPFDGPYWYVQPPDKRPVRTAHQAHGTPLGAEIESNNFVPVVMEAHQTLGSAIPIARCREIQVFIENRDNRAGTIAMVVVLTEAGFPEKSAVYLDQKTIASTEASHFTVKSLPEFETLRFTVPASARIRRFSEITVMLLPDIEHAFVAPKIAIQQFQLLPR